MIRGHTNVIRVDHLVIGCGVIGLAIAAKLATKGRTILIDKNSSFGQGKWKLI
jgi:L-2-hydroxyglutarate oxidase LhgO